MATSGDEVTAAELRRFVEVFVALGEHIRSLAGSAEGDLQTVVAEHMGVDSAELPSVGQKLPPVERPNLQLALDHLLADQPQSQVIGISPELSNYGNFSLAALISGRFHGPAGIVPLAHEDVPTGVDESMRCVVAGLWLLEHDGHPVVVGLAPERDHGPRDAELRLDVFARDEAVAQALLNRISELRAVHNVYRGAVLAFTFSEYGGFGIAFIDRPTTAASEVILPPDDLESIRRHAVGMGEVADQLRAANQPLKRGLLLYGPPGTGKTHTVRHLLAEMPDRTAVILQGPSVGALGQAAAIVRSLSPSMLVIEDVDLVAHERTRGPAGGHPLLFQLLNEMDGLASSDDVLFVLTTNRLDVLEPALAARPGRIDHAVEIGLPDAPARLQLLELYLGEIDHAIESAVSEAVQRSEGVTASFMRELVRRAVLDALDKSGSATVSDAHLVAALNEMLESSESVRGVLFGGAPDEQPPDHAG